MLSVCLVCVCVCVCVCVRGGGWVLGGVGWLCVRLFVYVNSGDEV